MLLQERTEEQTEVLDEVLLVVFPVGVGQTNVSVQRQHLDQNSFFSMFTTRNENVTIALSEPYAPV